MSKTVKKVQIALVVFGLFVVCYNVFEFITNKYSTTQGITFIIESLAGIVLIFLPQIMKKLFHLHIPDAIVLFYWFFLFISVFLGTGMHLISIISFWDKILHAVSPMVLTALGYGLIGLLLKKAPIAKTSPWLFLLFGFAFAGLCGVFWEFWEFLCDQFLGMNLQRFAASDGTLFVGRAALMDTMGDLLTNTVGALLMGIFAWVQGKNDPAYFESYRLEIIKSK
ncbi:hypothetical protein PMU66_01470 [Enterococcus durans]|uniref:hypothetical protein n=1 Tax=Enterococcus durans TaxID=53345 RepID=UPI00232E83C9|nr:hypothetical protein [Enterococcus durans]MDB1652339.1 hypothetical protein [Enterococcus durans]MDB1656311.1 hypothetical protein [Enterococcus durans]MDB1662765.1 hypothetical protein [Enterococcus durans]MDB1667909.1 hypothetical protein [Enterococcus durans]MDB1670744.1 hypothetical protein [Enterococcus durans]